MLTHCVNLVVKDAATRQGVFDIMDELDLIGKAVSIKFSNCTVLCTGDLLVGKKDATRHEVLDAMIANWMNDPVHGTKAGYLKMAVKLAERVEADLVPKAKKPTQKKRAASPEASGSGSSPGGNFSRNVRGRSGPDPGYNFVPGSHPNQRGGWLPSPAAAVAAVADAAAAAEATEAAEAEAEAVWPTTTTSATCLILAEPAKKKPLLVLFLYSFSRLFFLIVLCRKKNPEKNPRPICKISCCGYK